MKKLPRILLFLLGLALIASGIAQIPGAAHAETAPAAEAIEVADGEGRAVATLSVRGITSDKPGHAAIAFALENRGERALTRLDFTLLCLDAGGEVISNKPQTAREFFMDHPVPAGEIREFTVNRYFSGAENIVAVAMDSGRAMDEVELPPWTEPKPGNPLPDFCNDPFFSAHFENLEENLPVMMHYHVDEAIDEDITDPDAILQAIESLRSMRVGEEKNEFITDSGIGYWFTMADGSEWGVGFMAPGLLEWHGKVYEIEND